MKRPNITPGPWSAGSLRDGYHPITTPDGYVTVATAPMKGTPSSHRHNARAIAAVPDMMTALEDCLRSLERMPETEGAYKFTCIAQAKAALTKAGYTFD